MATKVSAITAPAVVNGSVMPNRRSSHWPTSPRRPKASSRATPPTTGGSTIGKVTSARTRLRPGKRDAGQQPGERYAEHGRDRDRRQRALERQAQRRQDARRGEVAGQVPPRRAHDQTHERDGEEGDGDRRQGHESGGGAADRPLGGRPTRGRSAFALAGASERVASAQGDSPGRGCSCPTHAHCAAGERNPKLPGSAGPRPTARSRRTPVRPPAWALAFTAAIG